MRLRLELVETGSGIPTTLKIVNNRLVGAPTGVEVAGTMQDSSAPWSAEILNKVITNGGTGIQITGVGGQLNATIQNNDLFDNPGGSYAGDLTDRTGQSGNISADPLLADPGLGDYSLSIGSPCIDAGASNADVPAADIIGTLRPQDGDSDGVTIPGIGAYEFLLHDNDGDGYSIATDCDDADPSVHPGAVDLPGNQLDEDCRGAATCDPAAGWVRHGRFVICVARECGQLVAMGAPTQEQCDALVRDSARSDMAKRPRRQPPQPEEP